MAASVSRYVSVSDQHAIRLKLTQCYTSVINKAGGEGKKGKKTVREQKVRGLLESPHGRRLTGLP